MNNKAYKTLEFHKIIDLLQEKAGSEAGKALCRSCAPLTDPEEIRTLQTQTADALSRIFKKGSLSIGSVRELRPSLKRLEIGSSLSQTELMAVASLLENTARVKNYGRRESNDTNRDSLDVFFSQLEPLTPISSEIRRCILAEDEIADDASPTLRQIRRSMKASGDKIHTQLVSLMNGSLRSYLQDSVITMRNGRYCLPIKSEYRSTVPGMIHDQSSTGSTVFLEPMAIVRLNNEIRELEQKEAKEIEVILAGLSELVASDSGTIALDQQILTELDYIFARGSLALDMNASEPVFNTEGRILLRKARHPLIEKKKVVPIDLELGGAFDLLIVTGPNTGGKTVSLKTTGLLCMMGQAGLHIPALERSTLPVFREIYADIGDEQSIEQSLSTFSAHMTNIVSFLEKADRDSLVLFDELGAGTDPTEGAALAISILSFLHGQGIRTMATTHYSELKMYALSTPGVENACCEFDVETLRPTYRLLVGVPGKSNAFAISGKLGLPEKIIEEARRQIDEEDESFEDVLANLEQSRISLEQSRESADRDRLEVERLKKELQNKNDRLHESREKILAKAREEAAVLLREAKEYADKTMRDFQKFGNASINPKEMEKRRAELRKKIEQNASRKEEAPKEKQKGNLRPSDLTVGDTVKVLSMNLKGTVSTKPDSKGMLFVQMGIIRSKVHISDLILLDDPGITLNGKTRVSTGHIRMSKSLGVRPEINLLGKTVDEAVAELDKYLDDAVIAHLGTVRIVHGKGTGALRKGIHAYLKCNPHVREFHLAEFGEGDAGVTIAKL